MNDITQLAAVLRGGRQCDEDGTEIIMSREACCVAADVLERLRKVATTAEAMRSSFEVKWHASLDCLAKTEQQRDELLAALKVLVENGGIGPEAMFHDARAAIANAEAKP